MPTLDWIFLGVLAFSMALGAWRGLVYEVLSVLSWLAAFVLAQWFATDVAAKLPMQGAGDSIRYAAGFLLVFVAAIFAGSLIAFLIKKLVAAVGLRPADRLLGAGFGVVRGVVLLLVVCLLVGLTPLKKMDSWEAATGPRWAEAALKGLKPVMPAEYGQYLP